MTAEKLDAIEQRIRQMRERLSSVITRPEYLDILLSTVQHPMARQELQRILDVIPEMDDALLYLLRDVELLHSDKE